MRIPLDSFESVIPETILGRGLGYWKKGRVREPGEPEPGLLEFIVEGTEDYTILLRLKNNVVTDFSCSCPYDLGPVCKHVAAALFALNENTIDPGKPSRVSKDKKAKPAKKRTTPDPVNELLLKLGKAELDEFIRAETKNDGRFRQTFLSRFAHLSDVQDKESYAKQIRAMVRRESDRGFLDYRRAPKLAMTVQILLDNAEMQFRAGNAGPALCIAQAVAEEMLVALENADDSDGAIGGCIESAFDLVFRIADAISSPKLRKELFTYALDTHAANTFSGWDWHMALLRFAAELACNDEEAEAISKQLGKFKKEDRFDQEAVATIRMELVRKFEGDKAADKILKENIDLPGFRKTAIEKAFASKAYREVEQLAMDGLKKDRQYAGLLHGWREWLLKVAQVKNETENIIAQARILFLDSHYQMKYYELMREYVPGNRWPAVRDELLAELKAKKPWPPVYAMAEIYARESMMLELLDLAGEEPELHFLERHEKSLTVHFPEKFCNLYETAIRQLLVRMTGRNHYQEATRYMRRMKKLGFREEVAALVDSLKAQYSKKPNLRPSLIEELEKV